MSHFDRIRTRKNYQITISDQMYDRRGALSDLYHEFKLAKRDGIDAEDIKESKRIAKKAEKHLQKLYKLYKAADRHIAAYDKFYKQAYDSLRRAGFTRF